MQYPSEQIICVREGVVSCDLDSGRAVLNLETSKYFRLNQTADHVWRRLEQGTATPMDLAQDLADHFDIDADRCMGDVEALISTFESAGLISRSPT